MGGARREWEGVEGGGRGKRVKGARKGWEGQDESGRGKKRVRGAKGGEKRDDQVIDISFVVEMIYSVVACKKTPSRLDSTHYCSHHTGLGISTE